MPKPVIYHDYTLKTALKVESFLLEAGLESDRFEPHDSMLEVELELLLFETDLLA